MSVQILMSTYNGEKYVRIQLDSILEQECSDIDILIRDDGSTDSTPAILKEYAERYSNISWYSGTNIGVQKSFFDLISKVNLKKDYYAFADQDDKWLSGKISRAISILENYPAERPALYCSDKIIVDEELKPIKVTVGRVMKKPSFGNALVQDMCTGCTAVINRSLLKLVRKDIPEYMIMHDWWLYLTGACFGDVYYDSKSYVLYRQHGNNVSGVMLSRRDLFKYRVKQLFRKRGEIYRQAESFWEIYGKDSISHTDLEDCFPSVSADKMKLIMDLLKSRNSLLYRIKLITNPYIFRQKKTDNFVLKFIILVGKL